MKRSTRHALITATAFGLAMGLFATHGVRAEAGTLSFEHVVSRHSFSRTVLAIKKGVAMNRMMIVGEINQQKVLAMNGLRLKGAETLFIGNPVMAKKLFSLNPAAGAAVPVRIYVWVDPDGKTEIGYFRPSSLLKAVDPGLGMGGQMLDDTLDQLVHMASR